MKRYLIAAIAALLITGTASAQGFNFGLKGGLNVYTLGGNDADNDAEARIGLHLGALAHIHASEHFAVQPELVYSSQGCQFDNNDVKLKLGYVNLPVLFQYMFDNGFRLEAGPQLGVLVSAKSENGNVSTDIKDNLKGADVSLVLGASYLHVPSGVGIDARYNIGVTSISENDAADVFNRGFQVGMFYQFHHHH